MLTNKLIEGLKTLDRKEMTRFVVFSQSPYFNKHQDVRRLIECLNGYYPDFSNKNCDRQFLFQKLFPSIPHDQPKLAILFTYSWRLFKAFLQHESIRRRPLLGQVLELESLQRKSLYLPFELSYKHTYHQLNEHPFKNAEYYYWQMKVAMEIDLYHEITQNQLQNQSKEEKSRYLDYFFLATKMKDACEFHELGRMVKTSKALNLVQEVVLEVEKRMDHYKGIPAIYVYYTIYKMLTNDNPNFYFRAWEIFKQKEDYFPLEELKNIYRYYQNYCIQRINKGDHQFLNEIFVLYQSELEKEVLIDEGYLSEWHYKNIVTTGIRLGKMDWVKEFIEQYKDRLPPESVDNAYGFNLAAYHYAVNNLDRVIGLLQKVEYNDVRYNLDAKALLLRTYFDLEEYEALNAHVNAFLQYIKRNKLLSENRKLGYQNLFKFTRRIAIIKFNKDFDDAQRFNKELQRIEAEVSKTVNIFNKSWLLTKINELNRALS